MLYRAFLIAILTVLSLTGFRLTGLAQTTNWNIDHSIGTTTGNYSFSPSQTPDPLVEIYPALLGGSTVLGYQWEQSFLPSTGFGAIGGATATGYTLPGPLTQTTYLRRKTYNTANPSDYIYSNIVKLNLVSVNWEDINYVRVHDVETINVTDWNTVDQMAIGSKFQSTTYLDGLGRSVEKVSRGTATSPVGTWGDIVQFSQYDQMGRESSVYLPYATTNQLGKYKTAPVTDQAAYYSAVYNETPAYSSITYDGSPLNRTMNIKQSGSSWVGGQGVSAYYDVNDATDSVYDFTVDYTTTDGPVGKGFYPAGDLYKFSDVDENGKKVVEYIDKAGKIILRKVEAVDNYGPGHSGWLCTYTVYDEFGLIRYQIQPEGVKYLNTHGWSFSGDWSTVLNEQCFMYNYDDKHRIISKKTPGANALTMLFDVRDRVVLTEDGNQASLATPQWTFTAYDDLDRPVFKGLYNTTQTAATLQSGITSAPAALTVSVSTPGQPTVQLSTTYNPLPASAFSNTANLLPLNITFYDNYSFTSVKSFNTGYTNLNAYSTSDPNVLPIAQSLRTLSMPTGEMTLVLGPVAGTTNTYLYSTTYYDEKGWLLQTLRDNIKGGTDINTLQHHFDGRTLSTCENHSAPGTGYTGFITLTKYLFDQLGRASSIQKQYGSNVLKTVASYDYDEMGRLKTRHLDPGYNNPNSGLPDLESLNYTFNIHNQLTGINKDYALKTAGSYNKWGHFFGLYLGYDNRDGVFTAAQLNGQVTGQLWNTQGDDAQRKYDYKYDDAGRLINAVFNQQQHPGDGWSNAQIDFSSASSYDYNGNLLTMSQKGIVPGTPTPLLIDDLHYSYMSYSNKLQSVTDQMTVPTINGQAGDFKDGTNAAGTPDYVYDANGNLVVDINKNVQNLNSGTNGIHYNFMDKPDQIRIVGKGTINIVYAADGRKLQRAFIPESGGSGTLTTYIDEFVYQQRTILTAGAAVPYGVGSTDTLSYINFEEGRIRPLTAGSNGDGLDGVTINGNITLANGQMGAWDYFIMDYQKNVRMILTEETKTSVNTCTMETTGGRPAVEDPVFGQTGSGNEVEATRYPTPAGWASVNTSNSVSRLGNLAGANIGPNTLQRVMAGDQVSASVQYYYQGLVTNSNPNIVPNIINSLVSAIGGPATAGSLVHGNGATIGTQLNNSTPFINAVEPTGAGGNTPQAYLTILFFDDRFNLIGAADGGVVQQQVASAWTSSTAPLALGNIKAPKNGYAYVYVSNRSDQDVYFDNLAVSVVTGNIIEEDHYYAFGLKIAGISSKKLGNANEGTLKNNYLYNDKELLDEDADLGWEDYGFRNYDPQIGRFAQIDPLSDNLVPLSPYAYAFNDPIANVDVDGLFGEDILGTTAETAKTLAEVVVTPAIHVASATSVVSSIVRVTVSVTSIVMNVAETVVTALDGPMGSPPAGNAGGAGPGHIPDDARVPYGSSDAAAVGWGRKYGQTSMHQHMELSSIIYEMDNKYYYTPAAYYLDEVYNIGASPSIDVTLQDWPNIVPKGAKIIGNIHSHDWTGDVFARNGTDYSFSTGNAVGEVKYRENDATIMARHSNYTYYLYNALGNVLVLRPQDPKSSGSTGPEEIAHGLPWDPEAIPDPLNNPTKTPMGPYTGHWDVDPSFNDGDRSQIYPIH